jgi:hypothetical protein
LKAATVLMVIKAIAVESFMIGWLVGWLIRRYGTILDSMVYFSDFVYTCVMLLFV